MTPHPWRDLRALVEVHLHWRVLPWPLFGVTDSRSIWLHEGMSQVQRRCALAHELAHVRAGHEAHQSAVVEADVRAAVARYLLPDLEAVADALVWAHTQAEAAEELWVTEAVLVDRLEGLSAQEREWMAERTAPWGT